METTVLKCVVERITFQNPENGYSVLRTTAEEISSPVTVVGYFLNVQTGMALEVTGFWKEDPRYGTQFSASGWKEILPGTVEGMEKYLGSGLVSGIGPTYAKRIVSRFGTDTMKILEEHPERLREVPGLGRKRVEKILSSWSDQKGIRDSMLFLQSNGLGIGLATRIIRAYGNRTIELIKENPFRLAEEVWGVGFKTADEIATRLGIQQEDFLRIRSGLIYTLNELASEGHVYARPDQLIDTAMQLLNAGREPITTVLDRMVKDRDIICDQNVLYQPPFFYAENGSAACLLDLAGFPARPIQDEQVQQVLDRSPVRYEAVQADAIRTAARSKVMVLTGGPGTGKTTTTLGIISLFVQCNRKVLLAAPTGRAAKRMTEATGMEAKTIHRLLEYRPQSGYQRNQKNRLEGDVLIVDECSMIDIQLFYSLVRALPLDMHLVLVGDVDQLPSVGAGNVLRDIIESSCFPVVRLQQIFRQARNSQIIMNAHRVNQGLEPDLTRRQDGDFFFLKRDDVTEVADTIVDLVKNRLPRTYGVKPSSIQVLTPMRKGDAGSINLNARLQEALNPAGESIRMGSTIFRLYDKVMQIRNNYDKDVFNGDIGRITAVDPAKKEISVTFDTRVATYDSADLSELVHAYATTIHKSQGSEYPIVVMPVHTTHYVMLQRNLLYTGITRAKRLLVLVGSLRAMRIAVNTQKVTCRNSLLTWRLQNGPTVLEEKQPDEYEEISMENF